MSFYFRFNVNSSIMHYSSPLTATSCASGLYGVSSSAVTIRSHIRIINTHTGVAVINKTKVRRGYHIIVFNCKSKKLITIKTKLLRFVKLFIQVAKRRHDVLICNVVPQCFLMKNLDSNYELQNYAKNKTNKKKRFNNLSLHLTLAEMSRKSFHALTSKRPVCLIVVSKNTRPVVLTRIQIRMTNISIAHLRE